MHVCTRDGVCVVARGQLWFSPFMFAWVTGIQLRCSGSCGKYVCRLSCLVFEDAVSH